MTLKGQKNHYNVKLLRRYGVSINLKNNKVCLKGGKDIFTGQQEVEEWFVTQIPYERIAATGRMYRRIICRKQSPTNVQLSDQRSPLDDRNSAYLWGLCIDWIHAIFLSSYASRTGIWPGYLHNNSSKVCSEFRSTRCKDLPF
jgi:hypothetical protein